MNTERKKKKTPNRHIYNNHDKYVITKEKNPEIIEKKNNED